MSDRILKLNSENKIDHLYDFDGGIDLMIFSIDSRGNFVFNDYESEVSLINLANNGNDIYSPGIASILMTKKIICFVLEDATEKVLKVLNEKMIEKSDALTYLQLHSDCSIYTLRDFLSKKEVNKNFPNQDYSEFRNEILEIQNSLKENVFEENDSKTKYVTEEIQDENLDGAIPESLESNNFNKNNLDKELEETLEKNNSDDEFEEKVDNELEDNLFSETEELTEETEQEENFESADSEELDEIVKETIESENEKLLAEFEKTLEKNEHITDYEINEDEQIYVVENLDDVDNEDNDEIISDDDSNSEEREISESIKLDSSTDLSDTALDEKINKLDLDFNSESNSELSETEPLAPEDLDKELLSLDSLTEDEKEKQQQEKPENIFYNRKDIKEKFDEIYLQEMENYQPKSNKEILKLIEIKTDTLKSIERMILKNRLDKLKDKVILANLKKEQKQEKERHIESLPSYIKLIYLPGTRPVPLLMLEQKPDEFEYIRIYTEMVKYLKLSIPRKKFDLNSNHIWNMGAYFTYSSKTNEIDLLAFSDLYNFVYLLRYLNKPLFFYLKKEDYLFLKEDLNQIQDEIKIVS
ncbi:MAG: hypothetical protein K2I67_00515, partial [Malacoplasma sp.]|nr:hypothetical protein [Malacoplasma sp.]